MSKLFLGIVISLLAQVGFSQTLERVAQFDGVDGTVQLLPGPTVIVREPNDDGQSKTIYEYQANANKFVRVEHSSFGEAGDWTSFNWDAIDFRDQVARVDFEDPDLASFLPKGSRVKGFAKAPGSGNDETLVFVCYSLRPNVPEDQMIDRDQRNLWLMMLRRGPLTNRTKYVKLANVPVAEQSYFGAMVVEQQAQLVFIALYSASGGRHQTNSLNLFLVRPEAREPGNNAKN
jgi:hypothetical protein